jgi:hypothetical protein
MWTCPNLRYHPEGMRVTMKIQTQTARHKTKMQTWNLYTTHSTWLP